MKADISQETLNDILKAHETWLCNGMRNNVGKQAILSHKNLRGLSFDFRTLDHIQLNNSILTGASFIGTCLKFANLNGIHMVHATFERTNLKYVDISYAFIEYVEFNDTTFDNVCCRESVFNYVDFSPSRLFTHVNFIDTTFDNSSFENTDLRTSNFAYCTCIHSNFCGAKLGNNIKENKFSNSNFKKATFSNSCLKGSYFDNTTLTDTIFIDTSFKGLIVGNKKEICTLQIAGYNIITTKNTLSVGNSQVHITEWTRDNKQLIQVLEKEIKCKSSYAHEYILDVLTHPNRACGMP